MEKEVHILTYVKIKNLFGGISKRYDLANHILSMGVDIYWRKKAAKLTKIGDNDRIMDMCCGTGDFAYEFSKLIGRPTEIIACDFSDEMIELANVKYPNEGIEFSVQDCTETSFENESFDVITCAFGVRNFNLDKGLGEMKRLLRPGGKICILEFSLPKNMPIRWLYLAYFKYILPIIGGVVSWDFPAYKYLVKSVIAWDKNVDMKQKFESIGMELIENKPLTFGIATIHIAVKK